MHKSFYGVGQKTTMKNIMYLLREKKYGLKLEEQRKNEGETENGITS